MPSSRARLSRLTVCAAMVALFGGFVLTSPSRAEVSRTDPTQPTGPTHAEPAATSCPAPDPATPKRQVRAVWIASVTNIDWPSRPGLSAAEQQAEYIRLLDEAKRNQFNAVVVQVRPTADAFWPSPYEPWSEWLSGRQGQSPGYDPLAFAVREAHARNLEFHAWFNPYRVSMQTDPGRLPPEHPARLHPDWIVSYGGKLYYDPGIPEVRHFVEDAILDAVRKYDVDGVHFDDYFYPTRWAPSSSTTRRPTSATVPASPARSSCTAWIPTGTRRWYELRHESTAPPV